MARLILASASPRRRELLAGVGLVPTVMPADVDESRLDDETPVAYVLRLAQKKAHAALGTIVSPEPGSAIIAADTTVHLGGVTFGKPRSDADAILMLQALSGATHQVSTGVCVMVCDAKNNARPHHADAIPMREVTFVETTNVTFHTLTDAEIKAYVASGEPRDKAGAYGVQSLGRLLVHTIHGDFFNVVGLPVSRVVRTLTELGYAGDTLVEALLARSGAHQASCSIV